MGALWPHSREHNVKRAPGYSGFGAERENTITAAWRARFAAPSPVLAVGPALGQAMAQPADAQPSRGSLRRAQVTRAFECSLQAWLQLLVRPHVRARALHLR